MSNFKMSSAVRLLAALLVSTVLPLSASAQNSSGKVTVTGTVLDETSVPAIGATVIVNGDPSQGATVTDADGKFSLQVPKGANIVISYVGYDSQTVKVSNANDLIISLVISSTFMEEAVVVGYGTQTKESLVGAISTVSNDDLIHSGSNSLTSSLTGKVSGLKTTTTNGAPGQDETTLMLRGLSSWNGSSPLVMVDGVERSMSTVSPTEVASISVLKDASATAVFGAKGANGVIIITTKTGTEGRPKINATVEYGIKQPLRLPEHIDSYTVVQMANVAYQNDRSFGSMYSPQVLEAYRTQSNPLRYPDVDWYNELFKKVTDTYNANFNISGGNSKVKYYAAMNYYRDNPITKSVNVNKSNYSSDRINYRFNIDANLTKTTTLSFKLGGSMTISSAPSTNGTTVNTGEIFNTAYMATGAVYPAYYPASALETYPDPNYPNEKGIRLANANGNGSTYNNPLNFLLTPGYQETTNHKVMTDVVLNQKLDFITKGLSAKVTASLTSSYYRNSEQSYNSYRQWSILWDQYDLGVADIWQPTAASAESVYVQEPMEVYQENVPNSVSFVFYLEGALNYKRSFGKNNVTGTVVYNQRQYNSGASSPKRNQSIVGRVTYNFDKKYLIEANAGFTGSEQFAPKYRYGFFPSVAAGYVLSNEKFWKKALPWWSQMKFRVSHGLVGSDSATSGFLYYNTYNLVTYTDNDKVARKHYVEGQAANDTARWETARKTDIGLEMGWFKNALTLNVDLYDEYRYDMLITPVTTPLIGTTFKDTNSGAMKKHGLDIELNYRKTHKTSFFYEIGGNVSLNENRILKYAEAAYAPQYQKNAGTAYKSQHYGTQLVDDKFFNSINELHGYPLYTSSWTNVTTGTYKYLDYLPDGSINDTDLFCIPGSAYPPCLYSLNFSIGYKGFELRAVATGTQGKYIKYIRSYMIPFSNGELSVHKAQLNYWTPTNHNAGSPALSFSDGMYSWSGSTSATSGYNVAIEGYTWRKSDYLDISEVYLAYSVQNHRVLEKMGVDGLTFSLTCNNLYTFSNLIEGHPQLETTFTSYYPLMRTVKFGVNVNF